MAVNLNDNNNINGQQTNPQQTGMNGTNNNSVQPDAQYKPKTSGFTNIQRVLGANQNNGLASTVQGGVENIANKTQNQTASDQANYNNQIGQAVQDIKTGNDVNNQLGGVNFTQNDAGSAQTLQNIGANQQYTQTAQNLQNGYNGPQGLQNAGQLQSQATDLQQTGQGLLSSGGRQAALQRFVNAGPNYTQGKQQLDTMLLGQNPDALRQAKQDALTTAGQTNQAVNQAQQQAQNISQQYGTTAQNLQNNLSNAGSSLNTALQNRLQGIVGTGGQASTDLAALQSRITAGTATDSDRQLLQNILGGNDNTYTLDRTGLNNIITNGDLSRYNVSNLANQGEGSAYSALRQLSGNSNAATNLPTLDLSQIGKADTSLAGEIQGDTTNLAKYNAMAQNATNAQNGFIGNNDINNYANKSISYSSGQAPNLGNIIDNNSTGINYQQAQQLFGNGTSALDQYLQANPNINTQGYIAPTGTNVNQQEALVPYLQQLQQSGILNSNLNFDQIQNPAVIGGGPMGRNVGASTSNSIALNPTLAALQNIYNQYNQTNTQAGIGNTLESLLGQSQAGVNVLSPTASNNPLNKNINGAKII